MAFGVGWAALFSISVTFEAAFASQPFAEVVWISALNVIPLVLGTAVLAAFRTRLFRPEWPLRKLLALHAAVALLFATLLSLTMIAMISATGMVSYQAEPMGGWARFLFGLVNGVFIYIVFVAFLMWSESMRRVQLSQAAVARAAQLRAEAEAKAVRAQFNPHFVFNTLHSLMLLVRADPAAAERAIEDVATLIRYASIIQRRDLDGVPLAKECEVARRYLGLEQLRLGPRLRTVWEVSPETRDLVIPPFALQTLVENAVKHGLEPSPGGGTVRITARRDGDVLEVRVEDDGYGGVPSEVLEPGHGLELLRRRLASSADEGASLSWETSPGEGFTVVVRVPAEVSDGAPELSVISERDSDRLHVVSHADG